MDIILIPLLHVLIIAIGIYINLVVFSVIYSFLMMFGILSPQNRYVLMVGNFFYKITQPFYSRMHKVIPPVIANIDFSPLILILLMVFLREVLAMIMIKFI